MNKQKYKIDPHPAPRSEIYTRQRADIDTGSYLFLRGINARRGADYGVFYRRPERALIEALDRYFLTGAVAAGESVESCP